MTQSPPIGSNDKTPETGGSVQQVEVIPSARLFGTRKELLIEHGDALYRLRITSQGKLILTK